MNNPQITPAREDASEVLPQPGERSHTPSGLRPGPLARDLLAPDADPAARALFRAVAAALAFALDADELGRELTDDVETSAFGPGVLAAQRLLAAHAKLAERRRALARGNERAARALLDEVVLLRDDLAPVAEEHAEARVALRLLDHVAGARRASSGPPEGDLVVARAGVTFQLGDGPRVDLRRRRSLRAILGALVSARDARPGVPVSAEELIAHGWPGERMRIDAASGRLYVAIRALRELGLRRVLLRQDAGYLLDPEVPLRVVD